MSKPLLYCDMDGVLVDFIRPYCAFAGVKYVPGEWLDISIHDWRKLRAEQPNFWIDLDWCEYGRELWELIKSYHPSILTGAPPSWDESGPHKKIWVERHLGKFGYHPTQKFHACPAEEKQKLAKQADGTPNILIDDLNRNIDQWNEAGGVGILYTADDAGLALVKRTLEAQYK